MKDYQIIRQKLTDRYAEIEARLARITNDARHADKPLDADFEEQAIERENEEVLGALDKSIRAEMAQIERTLARLDAGEYGVCELCANPIAPKRLEVLPHAIRCVACEEKRSNRLV